MLSVTDVPQYLMAKRKIRKNKGVVIKAIVELCGLLVY